MIADKGQLSQRFRADKDDEFLRCVFQKWSAAVSKTSSAGETPGIAGKFKSATLVEDDTAALRHFQNTL
jgi:hypothetical protein